MEYDKETHLPQQVETLFQLKAGGDIGNFEEVLDSVKLIMQNRTDFIDGLRTDLKMKENKTNEMLVKTKEAVLKALEEKDLMKGIATVESILLESKEKYGEVLRDYMHNVMNSCITYDKGSVEEGTVE